MMNSEAEAMDWFSWEMEVLLGKWGAEAMENPFKMEVF